MTFGLSDTGFLVKRLADIKTSVEDGLEEAFGEINVQSDGVFGQIIGVFSKELAEVWEQCENDYNAMYPSTADKKSLDDTASLVGVERLPASPSTVVVQMEGTDSTSVPINTEFSQGSTNLVCKTDTISEIAETTLHMTKITISTVTPSATYIVTIDGNAINYTSASTTTADDIAAGMIDAINADISINTKVIAEHISGNDFLIIRVNKYDVINFFSLIVDIKFTINEIWSPVACTLVDAGPNQIPVSSVETIDTPVSGMDNVTNLGAGITGANIESDSEFRIRRKQSLDIISAGTINAIRARLIQDVDEVVAAFVFENREDIVSVTGLPPHSFEVIVSALDTPTVRQAVADKIWEVKPAGIKAFGGIDQDITDSNGDTQIMSFSFAVTKYIYVELSYDTTNADNAFPIDGETQISNAILVYGSGLSFGSDILIQPLEATGYIADGVMNVTVRIAVSDTIVDPYSPDIWQTVNKKIAISELPDFDSTRIYLINVTP